MYCSSCGVAVGQGLSFCNYCGAKLSTTDTDIESREVHPGILVSAMVATFVLGLAAIGFLAGILKAGLELESGVVLGFVSVTFLVLLIIEGVFITLLFRRRPRPKELSRNEHERPQTSELQSAPARTLAEPISSITDHTTRAFDAIPRERS